MTSIHYSQLNSSDLESTIKSKEIHTLWVDSREIGFYKVKAPKVPKRNWHKVLPWTLDDISLQTPETLHVVVGEVSKGANIIDVIAIKKATMEELLQELKEKSIEVNHISSDVLALPVNENGWSLCMHRDVCLVRTGKHSGFCASFDIVLQVLELFATIENKAVADGYLGSEDMDAVIKMDEQENINESSLETEAEGSEDGLDGVEHKDGVIQQLSWKFSCPRSITAYQFGNELSSLQTITAIPISIEQVEKQWPFLKDADKSTVNFLQGKFKPAYNIRKKLFTRSNISKTLMYTLLLLCCFFLIASIQNNNVKTEMLKQQAVREIRVFLGGVVYDKRLSLLSWVKNMNQQLDYATQYKETTLWPLFKKLDSYLSPCKGICRIVKIKGTRNSLQIEINADINKIRELKSSLQSLLISGFKVTFNTENNRADMLDILIQRLEQSGSLPAEGNNES